MHEDDNAQWGLLHGFVLDGQGGGRAIGRAQLSALSLAPGQSLWLHWDRSHPQTQSWLRRDSGLSEFACDLLLEENTRPRSLSLSRDELLLFLRGVNLNPGAEPEDMVSLRIFADDRRILSLRLRPLRATEELIELLHAGKGPKNTSELMLQLAEHLTDKVETRVSQLADLLDDLEERIDADVAVLPDHALLLQMRRRAAALRRFLAPQRDIYAQLTGSQLFWLAHEEGVYWNELSNRLQRCLEELELTRERVGLLLETENRRRDLRMNHIMFRFAIITCIFLPMSFVTGLLGINLGGIPGSQSPYGFSLACMLLLLLGVGQWLLFRRLRWL
jgi:zinc transporter